MVLTHCASQTPLGAKSLFLTKISVCSDRGCTLCFGTFQIHLSSQNFYVNDWGMTRPFFFVLQYQGNSPKWRYEGFGLNVLVAEEEQSVSCRHAEIFLSRTTTICLPYTSSLFRNSQYRERPNMPKLNRNCSRMDDMRNRDRENDRTGPRSIFRPLPDPQTTKNRPKIYKKLVWGPSLGLCHSSELP